MSRDWDYTLETFVKERVATAEEWSDWRRVQTAKAPEIRPVWKDQNLHHEQDEASADYRRREEIIQLWAKRVPDKILSQEWEVSARQPRRLDRLVLETIDIERAKFNFDSWSLSALTDVRVRRRIKSKVAVMTDFIEKVCLRINPGAKLTKPVIEILAKQLCNDDYSDNAFAAAWDEADIDDLWRRKGPR